MYKDSLGLGIAGNFALHLEQAGESEDFKDLEVSDEFGPKGVFPFYLPGKSGQLGVYPISSTTLRLPDLEQNIQAEPEVALICDVSYHANGQVEAVRPKFFAAYSDYSIRKEGAKKISEKKNWGVDTKGLSEQLIPIDTFSTGGIMDSWRIASYLRRGETFLRYGEDVEISGYSYFHEKLLTWIVAQMNTQTDIGPLEPISAYLAEINHPKELIISIGATRYTVYGERTFLQPGDEMVVILYDGNRYDHMEICNMADQRELPTDGVSALIQEVIA